MQRIVILTGAGISAESGLATFRDNNGLWCNHRVEDVATPEAFERNPKLVHDFYNMRRAQLKEAHPNAAHLALAELAAQWPGNLLLVTQNVDDLHERADRHCEEGKAQRSNPEKLDRFATLAMTNYTLLHMHGELKKARCALCSVVHEWEKDLNRGITCPACNRAGYMRPHIVWFGEMPLEMDLIYRQLRDCDVFISIGTSGNVYPAAGFVHEARGAGAHCVELNMEPSLSESLFHERIYGPATQIVPEYVKALLKKSD